MKHLKTFENQIFEDSKGFCWLVKTQWYDDNESSIIVFTNEESAINCYLQIVNDELEEQSGEYFTKNDLIVDVELAKDWLLENVRSWKVSYEKAEIRNSYQVSQDLKLAIDAKKYNL